MMHCVFLLAVAGAVTIEVSASSLVRRAARTTEDATLLPSNSTRRAKALLVGFQYKQGGALMGVCKDLKNMRRWVGWRKFEQVRHFTDYCSTGLKEEEAWAHTRGDLKAELQRSFAWLVEGAVPGDTLLFHYSGHGWHVDDQNGDECNGQDECLVLPGKDEVVLDDELFAELAAKVPEGVHLFAIIDACHSGTGMDLPWNWNHWDYNRAKRFSPAQFDWEWADTPEALGRAYPLQGTVTLLSGSQNWQTSGDMGMAGGGVLTEALVTKHWTRHLRGKQEPLLTEALKHGWTWTHTVMQVIDHVTGGKVKAVSNTQVPNFGASHRFNMDTQFALDGIGEVLPTDPGTCRNS